MIKKFLPVLLTFVVAFACATAVAFTGCSREKPERKHTADSENNMPHVHSYGEWYFSIQPTCTQDGEKTRVCSCGEKEKQPVPALGHDVDESDKLTELATCQADGFIYTVCKRCGEKFVENVLQKSNSNYHYIDEGMDTTVCSGCGTKLATSMTLEIAYNGKYAILKEAEGTAVIVPAVYHGLPVTSIDGAAFSDCTSLESVTIPDSVTSIGGSAFEGCTSLESVTIPDSVTSIGGSAFYYCTALESIIIPDSVTSIGDDAFNGCTNLKTATIPAWEISKIPKNSLQSVVITSGDIGNYAFYNCTSLTSVTIGDGVTSIGSNAFSGCAVLESVTIGDGVTEIGWWAFEFCTLLNSVTIGNGVTSIGDAAFRSCTSLTSVTIGDGVTEIGSNAFSGCASLEKVNITSIKSWCNIDFGDYHSYRYYSNPLYYANNLYLDGELVKNLEIPEDVTSIKQYAFYNCTSLESVTIGKGVTEIGAGAFSLCTSLESIEVDEENQNYSSQDGILYNKEKTEFIHIPYALKGAVTIPDGITEIGNYAFSGYTALTSITIPDSVTKIGYFAFAYCTALESVYITSIKNWCNIDFDGGYSNPLEYAHNLYLDGELVKNLEIPNTVTSIGNYAFENCTSLESITIGDGVTSIGDWAFRSCTALTSVTIGDGVTTIYDDAFNNCTALERVNITSIKSWCNIDFYDYDSNPLYYAHNLYLDGELAKNLEIPEDVTSIGGYAFYECTSLTNITIPDRVTSIGNSAFNYCTALESVTIGNGVTEIVDYMFRNCTALESITIGNGVTSIGQDAFEDCTNLKIATIPALAISKISKNSLQSVVITSGDIGSSAFKGCTTLESITIPGGVTSIGSSAFNGCAALESITIGDSVTSIGSSVFENTAYYNDDTNWVNKVLYIDNHLIEAKTDISGSYEIKPGTKTIADSAFDGCYSLESITIPDSVTEIGNEAFYYCSSLNSVTIGDGVTTIDSSAFKYCTSLTSIEVDEGNKNYSSQDGILYNKEKTKFIHIPDAIKGAVTIPDGITSIAMGAFEYCTSLESVTIPDGVTEIGYEAFRGCTSLESIEVGAENKNYSSQDGILYNKEKTKLICVPGAKSAVTIPNSVTSIGGSAFYGCRSLTSITIPDSVTEIGWYAFNGCTNLKTATIPALAISEIPKNSLQSVVITSGDIGDKAFEDCTALESVTIGDGVTSIGNWAFSGCTALESVYITSIKSWCSIDFHSGTSNPLYYAHNLYLDGELVKNLEIPEDVTSIKQYAFYCTSLISVTIGNSVTEIGYSAFNNCTSLNSVTIGNGVTSIGNWAFANCTSLASVTFKNTVGWKAGNTAVDVTSPTSNAENLKYTYAGFTWRREG